jgi:dihydrofolate reductase
MIVAADDKDTIGKDGTLPWHLPEDLKRFRRLTTGHVVVAGRVTHESIVNRLGHPLPGRLTVVVTRTVSGVDSDDVLYRQTLADALETAAAHEKDEVFVIGGAEIYRAALPYVERVYVTRVRGEFDGDRSLDPGWLDGFSLVDEERPTDGYQFQTYERV